MEEERCPNCGLRRIGRYEYCPQCGTKAFKKREPRATAKYDRCKDCKYFAYFKEGDFYPGVTRHNGEKMPVRNPKTEGFCNHILMYKNGCSRIHTTKACTHFRRHGT